MIDLLAKEQGAGTRIWIAAGVTDMRRGFQGLAAQVQTALEQQPYSGHIFIFRGRRGDMVKLLWFDGDGLCLFQKRLERGRFVWPPASSGYSLSEPCPVVDVARRDRLESAYSHCRTGDECLRFRPVFMRVFFYKVET